MRILGISGTNGSGKDSLGEFLAQQGWLFISVTDMLRAEALRRGLPLEREHLRDISAEWRRESGLGVLIDKGVEEFKRRSKEKQFKGLVLASLRNPGESARVHELGGKVLWVDADTKVRYDRIFSRQRGTEDSKTYEQFLVEQQAEMHPSGDEATLNIAGVRQQCDATFINEFSSIEQMHLAALDLISSLWND